MTVKGGPDIETDGLVFHLDAAATSIGKGYSTEGLRVEYLVVGGGGGGGGWSTAGGGGAGGFLSGDTRLAAGTYTVTVGAGGTRGDNSSSRTGTTGGNTQLGSSLIAYGGGGGGSASNINGLNGGSGGGGISANTGSTGIGGTGVSGQGNSGGSSGGSWRSAGGGGAGGVGTNGWDAYRPARGGIGKISKLDFVWKYYAGGGTSGGCTYAGLNYSGALGGGGNGGMTNSDGGNGGTNLGGGGGGGGCYNTRATFGGNGGSGIVIIRYWGKQKATGGDTVQYKNGYTIHTFTSSGSFVLSESVDGTSSNKIVGTLVNMNSSNFSFANKGYWTFPTGNDQSISFGSLPGSYAKFTVIVWFYPQSVSNYRNVLDCNFNYNAITGNIGPRLEMNTAGALGWVYSNITNTNNVFYFHNVKNSGLSANQWHHVAITYNGNSNSSVTYYNGVNTGISRAAYGSTPTGFVNVMNNVVIGKGFHLGGAERRFAGRVANLQIYNRDLSSAEILDNYNATKGRFGL